jgi:hypothetical protein
MPQRPPVQAAKAPESAKAKGPGLLGAIKRLFKKG